MINRFALVSLVGASLVSTFAIEAQPMQLAIGAPIADSQTPSMSGTLTESSASNNPAEDDKLSALKAQQLISARNKVFTQEGIKTDESVVAVGFSFNSENSSGRETVEVDLGDSINSYTLVSEQTDPLSDLDHYFYQSEVNDDSWVALTVDENGNPYISAIVGGERQTFAGTKSGELVRLSGRRIPQATDALSRELDRRSLVRHLQVVELTQRKVPRSRSTDVSHRLVYASGGELGFIQNPRSLKDYLVSIDPLFDGAARLVDAPVRQVIRDDEVIYYISQVIGGIPVIANDIRIRVDAKTGAVKRIGAPIYNPPVIDVSQIDLDVKALEETLTRHFSEQGIVAGFTEKYAPKLIWTAFDGDLTLVWRGTVTVSGEGPITYYVDARSYRVISARSELLYSGIRPMTCDGLGNKNLGADCTGTGGTYPWVRYEDNDNVLNCNTQHPTVTTAKCNSPEHTNAWETVDAMEDFWDEELGYLCCDVSNSVISVFVYGSSDNGNIPHYDPDARSIYLPQGADARSQDVVAHEAMHALQDHLNRGMVVTSDRVARAISEGLSHANAALYKGSWTVYNDGAIAPSQSLSTSRSFSDYSTAAADSNNGLIIGHLIYKLATLPGGSAAKAKEILLKSIAETTAANDGNDVTWSFNDFRIGMIAGVEDDAALVDLIEDAFDSVSPTPAGGGCSSSVPSRPTNLTLGARSCLGDGRTQWPVSWSASCPGVYYELTYAIVSGDGPVSFAPIYHPSTTAYVRTQNITADLRVRSCSALWCSPRSTSSVRVFDNCSP